MPDQKKIARIIPHTHWDREWRYPIWKTRMLLVSFMKDLLNILETDPQYTCFLMDGQSVPILDYLEVVPEDKERIKKYVSEGRLVIGPWYTLPDLYPLDGECLVRNLLKGTRLAKEYGGCLKVGYNSFGWGQTAQFPQIYSGFGIDFIICAKKVSKERAPQSEFMWQAPDGTTVLTSRLGESARANFYFNTFLYSKYGFNCMSSEFRYSPKISGTAVHRADESNRDEDFFITAPHTDFNPEWLNKGMNDAWAATDATACKDDRLFLNGTDFSTPHPELTKMREELLKKFPDVEFVHCHLEDYTKALHEKLDKTELKLIKGELRDGPAGECSGNALASRIYLKIKNKKAQIELINQAEPWDVASMIAGGVGHKHFLDVGWKYLLEAHPHDSINGVTQDKTANDVEYRLAQALEIGQVVADESIHSILDQINFENISDDENILTVFNPHPHPTSQVLKVCVAVPRENTWSFSATDCDGNSLGIQEISRDEKAFPVHDQEARPWPYLADRHYMYLETGEIPAIGYKTIILSKKKEWNRDHFYWLPARESLGMDICSADNVLENEYLRAEINPNGTIRLTDKQNNKVYDQLHYFEDTGDVGNYWAYAAPYHNRTYTTLTNQVNCWCEDNGNLSATIACEYKIELPVEGYESRCGIHGSGKRSENTETLVITSRFTLTKDAKRLDVHTEVNNNIKNHRLRLALPTGISAKTADASGHFTVDSRPAVPTKDKEGKYWPEMQTLPMQNFVDVSDGNFGFGLIHNCLTEYELRDDEKHTIYATLLRSMGNMIVTWSEAVGEFDDQSGSQMQRTLVYDYALYPHSGNWEDGNVYEQSRLHNVPCKTYQICGPQSGNLPMNHSFFSMDNKNLVISSIKQAEDSERLIIRLFNPTSVKQTSRFTIAKAVNDVCLCDLNEEKKESLKVSTCKDQSTFSIIAESNKIITISIGLENN